MVEKSTPRDPKTGRFMSDEQYAEYTRSQHMAVAGVAALCLIAVSAASYQVGYLRCQSKFMMGDRDALMAKLDAITTAQADKPMLLGAGPDDVRSPWHPPEPQPRYQTEYVVTGEAQRLRTGQMLMTIGFYAKDGRGMGSAFDAAPKLGEPTIIPQADDSE